MIPLRDSIPLQRWPVITWLLIGMNVWAFLNELLLGPELEAFIRTWGFIPARYFELAELNPEDWAARYLPIFTSMFLHGGWLHLLGNMVFLWIFGDNVEDRLGHLRFLLFYIVAGAAAGLTQVALNPTSVLPTVGASGAIAACVCGSTRDAGLSIAFAFLSIQPFSFIIQLLAQSASLHALAPVRDH